MEAWRTALESDPVPWLLERDTPAVRHQALRLLLDEPEDSAAVRRARAAATRNPPISAILEAQDPEGFWVKPGSGYSPKYTSTVWSMIFLDQLGADPGDRRVRAGCRYVLEHAQASNGGFGWQATPSTVVHCLNGNLLRALLGFGWLEDPRVKGAIAWEGGAITGEGVERWHPWATSGPGFGCGINGKLPCAWGAIKALRGLARVPPRRRSRPVLRAIAMGTDFLLSCDPAAADYPTDTKVSPSWFKLGFPSGYVADVLQNLEVLAEFGHARDPRLTPSDRLGAGPARCERTVEESQRLHGQDLGSDRATGRTEQVGDASGVHGVAGGAGMKRQPAPGEWPSDRAR